MTRPVLPTIAVAVLFFVASLASVSGAVAQVAKAGIAAVQP